VKKGERGIRILVPHKRKITDEAEEEERFIVSSFGVGSVFDISQTKGPPIPEPPQVLFVPGASDPGMRLYVDLLDSIIAGLAGEVTSTSKWSPPDQRAV